LCGGIFTILSAPVGIFCQDNEFFRKQNPFRKKAWQELEEKENQILETDRRIESLISRHVANEPRCDISIDEIIEIIRKEILENQELEETFRLIVDKLNEHTRQIDQLDDKTNELKENTKVAFYQILDIMNEDKKTYYEKLSLLSCKR
jgi:hypothetical protein